MTQVGENEWWITETMSGYDCRVSKSFKSKEEAIETLRKGNCDEQILQVLGGDGFIATIPSNGVTIDNALHAANALCPSGEYSLSEDGECAKQGCEEHVWEYYPDFAAEICDKCVGK